jgi:hypothetical protein
MSATLLPSQSSLVALISTTTSAFERRTSRYSELDLFLASRQSILSFMHRSGEYLSIETPVPTGLDPEESDNFNIGAIITPLDNLTLTVDYYNMALAGPFGREACYLWMC